MNAIGEITRGSIIKAVLLLSITTVAVVCTFPRPGMALMVEPDIYEDSTNISSLFPGVNLSATSLYSPEPCDISVFSITSNYASTGTNVFGRYMYNTDTGLCIPSSTYWGGLYQYSLRADFDSPARFIAVDVIPRYDNDTATLKVYNSSDSVIDTYSITGSSGQGNPETAFVSRSNFDISYAIIAFDTFVIYPYYHEGYLDNLVVEMRNEIPIPEPTTMLLLGAGMIGLAGLGRKKFFKKD